MSSVKQDINFGDTVTNEMRDDTDTSKGTLLGKKGVPGAADVKYTSVKDNDELENIGIVLEDLRKSI